MAKRYHQTKEDRMHESRGMRNRMHEGYYEGHSERRRQEMQDAGMIHEDHSAIANLPQEVMMKPWPDAGGYEPEVLDDTIRGINKQKGADHSKMMKNFMPHKY